MGEVSRESRQLELPEGGKDSAAGQRPRYADHQKGRPSGRPFLMSAPDFKRWRAVCSPPPLQRCRRSVRRSQLWYLGTGRSTHYYSGADASLFSTNFALQHEPREGSVFKVIWRHSSTWSGSRWLMCYSDSYKASRQGRWPFHIERPLKCWT